MGEMNFKRLLLGAVLAVVGILIFVLFLGSGNGQEIQKVSEDNLTPHSKGYEDAWVVKVGSADKLVEVQTVTTKIDIVFKAEDELINFVKPRVNWIVPVTFNCGKPDKKCDLQKPYTLYVAGRRVEPVSVQKHTK